MGLPEILHRCNSCGAAIREPAMFCPECGKPLENAMSETSEQSEPQTAVAAQALGDNLAADASSPVPNHADAKVAEPATTNNVSKTTTAADQAARHGAREKTR